MPTRKDTAPNPSLGGLILGLCIGAGLALTYLSSTPPEPAVDWSRDPVEVLLRNCKRFPRIFVSGLHILQDSRDLLSGTQDYDWDKGSYWGPESTPPGYRIYTRQHLDGTYVYESVHTATQDYYATLSTLKKKTIQASRDAERYTLHSVSKLLRGLKDSFLVGDNANYPATHSIYVEIPWEDRLQQNLLQLARELVRIHEDTEQRFYSPLLQKNALLDQQFFHVLSNITDQQVQCQRQLELLPTPTGPETIPSQGAFARAYAYAKSLFPSSVITVNATEIAQECISDMDTLNAVFYRPDNSAIQSYAAHLRSSAVSTNASIPKLQKIDFKRTITTWTLRDWSFSLNQALLAMWNYECNAVKTFIGTSDECKALSRKTGRSKSKSEGKFDMRLFH